jgi:hypothetical protein
MPSVRQDASPSRPGLSDAPTGELLELALRQAGDLVRAEASLATAELKGDVLGALVATVNMVAAVVLLALAVALGAIAALLTLGAGLPTTLFATAGVLASFGFVATFLCLRSLPRTVLERSRERVADEIRQIEDHAS